jgi:hypothetical protein
MAGGKRFKFTGSTIAVLAAYAANPKTITAVSKANPAVVTSTAHGYANGDVVRIAGVVGMTDLNGEVFVINNVTTNTFDLVDTDSTGYATYTSGGTAAKGVFSNFCELTGYNRAGGSSPEIDATSLCSTASEFELGLPDFGTTQLDYNFAPRTSVQTALESLYRSGAKMAVKVSLPNSGGDMIQLGFVQQTGETVGNGGIWTGSITIRNTGQRVDVASA